MPLFAILPSKRYCLRCRFLTSIKPSLLTSSGTTTLTLKRTSNHSIEVSNRVKTSHTEPTTMHSSELLLALGFTLAATINAIPVLLPTPTLHPIFTVVSRTPTSTASGVANATAGKFPAHKHTPDCEHNHNGNHNSTIDHGHHSTTEDKGHITEGADHDAESQGNPSPHPNFDASSYTPPNPGQAHNHTGHHCDHLSHYNNTATGAADDKPAYPEKVNASADSSHAHTGYRCAHPSHHNGTSTADPSYDKRSVVPEVDVTVCLGSNCEATELVTAQVDDTGKLVGMEAKNGNGVGKRQDMDLSFEEFVRQMSGARIAGGV